MLRAINFVIAFMTFISINAQKVTVTQLEVDKLTTPSGLDNQNPDFSWILKSDEYNLNQTHYQVFVATDKIFSKKSLVWDAKTKIFDA